MADDWEKADALEDRLIDFAVAVIHLSEALPHTPAGQHVSKQILRCGTSPAPNYGEVRGAESKDDFIHKLGIVRKELNETKIWLKIARKSRLLKSDGFAALSDENLQLCRIINSSYRTARSNQKRNRRKTDPK